MNAPIYAYEVSLEAMIEDEDDNDDQEGGNDDALLSRP